MVSVSQRNGFAELPEGCIANILSWTTPKDAGRAGAVDPLFRAAAESDTVWNRMLPSGWEAIIAQSVTPLNFPSLKHLFLSLSDNPILIDGARKSFFLDKSSGKKCYLLSARELSIVWGNTPTYWRWISLPEAEAEASRFPEVAELNYVWFFDISCKMSTSILSPNTHYATYLVYKLRNTASGFGGRPFRASVETIGGGEVHEQTVHLGLFVMRNDGWDRDQANKGGRTRPVGDSTTSKSIFLELLSLSSGVYVGLMMEMLLYFKTLST
ncbi:hypothetical protein CMV_015194 [Castanea mollissima]|uniref:F-box domain-containing protein n=1 Tax=Castanea mollissima TaxID=60419 RepID=A0A8J4VTM6_9ROSI|nr:hypothetical protein CMV_015194 [Castanea mollissima]